VGAADTPVEAYQKAFETDPESPFGGILVCNTVWDLALAEAVDEIFTEVLIAPDFSPEALALLQKKKNRRLMRWHVDRMPEEELDIRAVTGGFLVQDRDTAFEDPAHAEVRTRRAPSVGELAALSFGWRVVKHVKSNAVVLAGPDRTLGLGGGQTSRVDAVRIAIEKATRRGLDLSGSALASDAFFPFPDGVELALEAGASAVVQPGGSVKDDDAVAAADARNATMVMTGRRHFRH
jgi:phosphoribosylaminoimidazolecarboxamide formyltransferase/IMP cyclohydrolase